MTTLNKLIYDKSKEIFNIFEESSGLYITKSGKWRTSGGGYNFDFEKERKKIENTLANAIQSGYELAIKDVLSEIKPLILSKENLKVGQDTINLDFNDGVKNCINVIENTYQSLLKGEKC